MHIVDVFSDHWECSCGVSGTNDALNHIKENTPGIITDRKSCSKKCLEEISVRNFRISFHDDDCPMYTRSRNG